MPRLRSTIGRFDRNWRRCSAIAAIPTHCPSTALDEQRGRQYRGESIDTAEMLRLSEALERYLPPQPEPMRDPDDDDDPRERLQEIVARYIAAREAQRAEDEAELRAQGLPANEQEATALRIASLEAEIAHLRAKHNDTEPVVEGEVLKPEQEMPADAKPITPRPLSDAEREANRQRINNDRSIEHKVMGNQCRDSVHL
jgi:hypothetical protein